MASHVGDWSSSCFPLQILAFRSPSREISKKLVSSPTQQSEPPFAAHTKSPCQPDTGWGLPPCAPLRRTAPRSQQRAAEAAPKSFWVDDPSRPLDASHGHVSIAALVRSEYNEY